MSITYIVTRMVWKRKARTYPNELGLQPLQTAPPSTPLCQIKWSKEELGNKNTKKWKSSI